jgi:ATP-dependent Lon protease
MMPGKGKMTVTGNLRDVMKESISASSLATRLSADFASLGAQTQHRSLSRE